MNADQLQEEITRQHQWISDLKKEISRVLIGQKALVDRLLIALLANGHVLLEGVPGLAKTLAVNALAGCLQAKFSRLQFTPDLLPADLLGTMIYHPDEKNFAPKLGPIFANLILADEINRAPAKVQSALLESMQERQVTLGDSTYPLPEPFLVLATQNPIDQEGTYQLPEAQLDRFLLKVLIDYPSREEELQILDLMGHNAPAPKTKAITDPQAVSQARQLIDHIHIDPAVKAYIVDLVHATRQPAKHDSKLKNLVRAGASPRATINLARAARAQAFLQKRAFVTPTDIKSLAPDILRHRLILTYEAEAENIKPEEVISRLLARLPVP